MMKIAPFRLERYFAKYEFTAPYLLCCSDCETLSIADLLAFEPGASEAFNALALGYTESLGNLALRAEIATLYQELGADEILVHAGAEEAIFNFMQTMLEPGDQLIVHAPHYQSLSEVALSLGVCVTEWNGNSEQGWALDLQDLKAVLTEKTKVVVVNCPHNPTGFLADAAFWQELSRLSDQYGFIVFSDEVYRGLEYDPARQLPAFADINDRAVSLGVMSKTYGLAGLRIGWIATRNQECYRKMASFKDYTTICNSAPSEFLACLALRHREPIVARNRRIIQDNLQQLDAFFADYPQWFRWQAPQAGPIAFPQFLGKSVTDFCAQLVEKTGVLLLPGTLYEDHFPYFRLGFGRQNMGKCLQVWNAFMQDYSE